MYICARHIDFSTDSTIIRLDFVIVPTVWYFFLHYIANDTSEMNTSATEFGIIKRLCTRITFFCVLRHASLKCAVKHIAVIMHNRYPHNRIYIWV